MRPVVQCILTIVILAGAAHAAKKPELKFLKSTDLPNISLKVRLMPDHSADPLAPPRAYTYEFTSQDKTRTWKSDMYAPRDLWFRRQQAGRWLDKQGNALTLATMTHELPGGFDREHITREQYQEHIQNAGVKTDWTSAEMIQWIKDFTGATSVTGTAVKRKPIRFKNMVMFSLEGMTDPVMAYAFCLNRPSASRSRNLPSWYFALFEVNPEISATKARDTIEKSFFANVTTSVSSRSGSDRLSSRFQLHQGAGNRTLPGEFIQSRKDAIASVQNMKSWWHVTTDNYVMLSNLPSRYTVSIKQLQQNLELLRRTYKQFVPPRVEIRAISVIRLFATAEEYTRYVGKDYKWSGGLWMPQQKELVIRPINWGGSKDQRDTIFRTTYHEAFHQYLFYALDQIDASVWFNEGHAEFFEVTDIRNGWLTIGENERHLKVLEKSFTSGTVDIAGLLALSHGEFYGQNPDQRDQNYALAWALVYYLRRAAPLTTPRRYTHVLPKYEAALWTTKDAQQATREAFAEIDAAQFERDFLLFWNSRNKRGNVKRSQLLPPPSLSGRR